MAGPRDTTKKKKKKVWRPSLWIAGNTKSMSSDPKQTQWVGKNAGQEGAVSPRLTVAATDSGAPIQGSPLSAISQVSEVRGLRWFVRQGDHGWGALEFLLPGLAHSASTRKQKKGDIWDLWHHSHRLAPSTVLSQWGGQQSQGQKVAPDHVGGGSKQAWHFVTPSKIWHLTLF